jgi:replicative DNA helicase
MVSYAQETRISIQLGALLRAMRVYIMDEATFRYMLEKCNRKRQKATAENQKLKEELDDVKTKLTQLQNAIPVSEVNGEAAYESQAGTVAETVDRLDAVIATACSRYAESHDGCDINLLIATMRVGARYLKK